ncbi:MAG TPA: hypothetical protein VLF91_05850 [Candidatus Saccharimonadales bacterium]|nr:hypothetical protein [Candidatus Saccharimonadales bacterium]
MRKYPSYSTCLQVIVWLAALYIVVRLGSSPTVVNAWLQFYVVGAVPGTHIVLTPDQVFVVLGAGAFVAISAIFYRDIFRVDRRRGEVTLAVPLPSTAPVIQPRPVIRLAVPARPSKRRRAPGRVVQVILFAVRQLRNATLALWFLTRSVWRTLEPWVRRADRFIERSLRSRTATAPYVDRYDEVLRVAQHCFTLTRTFFARATQNKL